MTQSALRFLVPVQRDGVEHADGDGSGLSWSQVANLAGAANGATAWSRQWNLTGFTHDSEFLIRTRNRGSGGLHQRWEKSTDGSTIATMTDAGLTTSALTVTTLTATTANVTTLNVSGTSTLHETIVTTLAASGDTTIGGTLAAGATTVTDLTATGNTALGNANTDTVTVIGVSTFRNAANTLTQLKVDAGNNRVIVGSGTALASDTTPALHVVGRAYVAPDSANDLALELRRSSASATPAIRLGVDSNGALVVKDETDTIAFIAAGVTYALAVTGDAQVSDDFAVGTRAVIGGSTWSSTEELRVVGQTRLEGATTITTGALTVSSGNVVVSAGDVTVTGDVIASDEMQCGSTLAVGGAIISSSTGNVFSLTGSSQWQTTVGAAGGSSALPAAPAAYLKFALAGTNYVIPFYSAS